jgi:ribokinase
MPTDSSRVLVVGSINMDLVVRCPHIPQPGETVLGESMDLIPGGKGANQAVAAARLGAECHFVGTRGDDDFGRAAAETLADAGVNIEYLRTTTEARTGAAMITLDPDGQNAITVASGANRLVRPQDVDRALPALRKADVCLLQMEIPLETNLHAIRLCADHGVTTVLDAAPAVADPPADLFRADVLTANLSEAETLTGLPAHNGEPAARRMIDALARRGLRRIVLKLGELGCLVYDQPDCRMIDAHRVDVVDTTAAGDAFNAALGVYLARKHDLFAAARRANAAGALACTKLGAMPAMPDQHALDQIL